MSHRESCSGKLSPVLFVLAEATTSHYPYLLPAADERGGDAAIAALNLIIH